MATNSTSVKLTMKVASLILQLLLNIFFYIVVIILTVSVSKMAFDFTYQLYGPGTMEEPPGRDITFQIKKGESTMEVAGRLENSMLIKNKYSFYLKTKLEKTVIMPGKYTLNTSMTYANILSVIADYSDTSDSKETGSNSTQNETVKTASD